MTTGDNFRDNSKTQDMMKQISSTKTQINFLKVSHIFKYICIVKNTSQYSFIGITEMKKPSVCANRTLLYVRMFYFKNSLYLLQKRKEIVYLVLSLFR